MTRTAKRFRAWPGVVFPAGLTLLLVLAGWQFATGVGAERERRNAAALELAGYARMEAGELARRAGELARAFAGARLAARDEQEKNLRVEIRGVMEAVNRVLGASLERSRAQGSARREVPDFPSGFESVKSYLEFSRPGTGADQAVKALHACAPELGGLLPSGCSLAVVEDGAVEIFSLGGGAPPENSRAVEMGREFLWSDGSGGGRRWTVLLKLHAPDRHPLPEAAEIARHLADGMAGAALENASWRGWLIGRDGQPSATFPSGADGAGREPPPFTGIAGEWVEIDGRSLVWLEDGGRTQAADAGPAVAVAVAIDRPAPPLDTVEVFLGDARWICTLGALALGALGFWVWFVRNMLSGGRRKAPETEEAEVEAVPVEPRRRPPPSAASAGADAVAAELRRRLVRDNAARTVDDVEGVIVADIGSDGGMTVSAAQNLSAALRSPSAAPAPRPAPLPSGSLFRLQARHRGGKGRQGSRALDRATHPVLKTLAARIRPVVNAAPAAQKPPSPPQPPARPRGRATEKFVRDDNPQK